MSFAGVYLHIPFCRSRCSYCDFATDIYKSVVAERYTQALVKEISAWGVEEALSEVDTIYFGGGTPSLLTPAQTSRILDCVHKRFRVRPGAEVTMEMNPGTITLQTLREFRITALIAQALARKPSTIASCAAWAARTRPPMLAARSSICARRTSTT
ncbi:MAG: radical SAM protein [Pyrinomonadaceae bacterium]